MIIIKANKNTGGGEGSKRGGGLFVHYKMNLLLTKEKVRLKGKKGHALNKNKGIKSKIKFYSIAADCKGFSNKICRFK